MVPVCLIEDCEKPSKTRGWCGMHYARWTRHGDPLGREGRPRPICSIADCSREVSARGWCSMHYKRWRNHNDPNTRLPHGWKGAAEDRFWEKVIKTPGCWFWQACRNKGGYGVFGTDSRHVLAHRFAWEAIRGPIPPGALLDHRCHERSCVNPDHLRIATSKQNGENRKGPRPGTTSGIRGVSWSKSRKKWEAFAVHNRTKFHLGYFSDIGVAEDAAIAKRNELFTHNDLDRVA